MRHLVAILCFALIAVGAVEVVADEDTRIPFEGSYLLTQDDGYHRIISIDGGGTASIVSNQQALIGFTTGQGAWEQTSSSTAVARIIDFSLDTKVGTPVGPSMATYQLTFSDKVDGKFTKVRGTYNGQQFAGGDNPLNPSKPAVRSYGIAFQGERITPK